MTKENQALLGTASSGDSGNKSTPKSITDSIRGRLAGMLEEHGFSYDATDFKGDYLLRCAVTELRWCLRLAEHNPADVIVRDLAACDPISNDCSAWCQLCVVLNSEPTYDDKNVVHTPDCPWARAKALTDR